jgi:hypothetical protein
MFKALDTTTGKYIISIDPVFRGKEEELRPLARSGQLVCSVCKELITFRFRETEGHFCNRPHFAHRQQSNCPVGREPLEVMQAKVLLFEWLLAHFPRESIDLDVDLSIPCWDNPADLYVQREGKQSFAYWIFDHGIRKRQGIVRLCKEENDLIVPHIIWTQSALQRKTPSELILNTTHRDLIMEGSYDANGQGGHLTFLNTETEKVSVFRDLWVCHRPKLYRSDSWNQGSLTETLIDSDSGELFFHEDTLRCDRWEKEERERLEIERRREQDKVRREEEYMERCQRWHEAANKPRPITQESPENIQQSKPCMDNEQPFFSSPRKNMKPELLCTSCGRMTSDYSFSCSKTKGTCKCNDCMLNGR